MKDQEVADDVITGDDEEILSAAVVQALVDDARARGYAEGRNEGQVRLALLADELRMMPGAIVDAYGALCVAALSDGMEGRGGGGDVRVKPKPVRSRTSTGQTESRGLPQRTKPPIARGGADVRSVRLLAAKTRVDRKLRALAREIERELEGGGKGDIRKCTRCGKYGEETWSWCPWDGAAMTSEDRGSSSKKGN